MIFLNGGPARALTPAFSYSIACQDRAGLDAYSDKLAWRRQAHGLRLVTGNFGLCWQVVPHNRGEILKYPRALAAMMTMVKLDIAALQASAQAWKSLANVSAIQ